MRSCQARPTASPPTHLGIVVDGHRRWAQDRGVATIDAHVRGYEVLKRIAAGAFDRGVAVVSAYLMSTENWNREDGSMEEILALAVPTLEADTPAFVEQDIRVVWLGSTERLTSELVDAMRAVEHATARNARGTLCLCLNYGGHEEIADACRAVVRDGLQPDEVTVREIEERLYHPEVPPVDLLVRTSGEQRLSGFMLWRLSYAEVCFVSKHWPDFEVSDLDEALVAFAGRRRRYGL